MRDVGRTENGSVWMFMAATAMATTISTLAATAMADAESAEPVQVTCECEAAEAACPAAAAAEVAPAPAAVAEAAPAAEVAPPHPSPVRQSKMDVRGGLDQAIIRRIVAAHIDEVRYCYNQGLARDPDLAGRVAVQFTIGPSGKVPVAVVAQTSLEDEDVASCMTKAVKRWVFPKPPGGGNVVVTYPFVLEPG